MAVFSKDFEVKETTNNNYMKFVSGENKIRILSEALEGWLYWVDKTGELVPKGTMGGEGAKPVRVRTLTEAGMKDKGAQYEAKQFSTFIVYNYKEKSVQVLEITQTTVMKALVALDKSDDWGDLRKYDVVIDKSGEKLETEYNVRPVPAKEFTEDASAAKSIRLEALFEGGDPFVSGETTPSI